MRLGVLLVLLMSFVVGLSLSARAERDELPEVEIVTIPEVMREIPGEELDESEVPGVSVPRPVEFNVPFDESVFESKPWTKEFEFVIVVNKATQGPERQSIRVYRNQVLVQFEEIEASLNTLYAVDEQRLNELQSSTRMSRADIKNQIELISSAMNERASRIKELKTKMRAPGVFRVSTGRDAFEKKGEHHSQKDSWSVTPAGWFVPQYFARKHKSESYSTKSCDSAFGKFLGAILKKELCTYMEHALFFNVAIALHKAIPGTEGALGSKASGGCVRLPAALAEYIYVNVNAAKGHPVPAIQKNGEPKLDAAGNIIRETMHKSEWGTTAARSALIVVQSR